MNNYSICKINRLDSKEIKQILKVQKECLLSKWTSADYKEEVKKNDSLILTAKIKKTIIGFLTARLIVPGQFNNNQGKFCEIDILNFGVNTKHQKQGIGKILLSELLKIAVESQIESIWLEVRELNINAVNFYKRNGFAKVQIRNHFYREPVDNAIVMKLKLSPEINNQNLIQKVILR